MRRATVCIPTHNSRSTLPGVLDALMRQELEDFDVLICDDASTDGTWEFLQSLEGPRLKIIRNNVNLNLPGTMQRLFALAAGEFICMHHDHEYVKPGWLREMIALFDQYPMVGMAVPAYDVILADGRAISRPQISEDSLFHLRNPLPGADFIRVLARQAHTPVSAHGTVFRAATVRAVGGYSDRWGLASDEDLYRRVAMVADVAYCPEPVVVVVTRSRERHFSLGTFGGICTVSEFRKDVVRAEFEGQPLLRSLYLARLSQLEARALVHEILHRWMLGTKLELELAQSWDKIPDLPSGRPVPSRLKRVLIGALVTLLSSVPTVGRWIGHGRRSLRRV
jgi:glycosyltransferase involved in cell wall biosynthesis